MSQLSKSANAVDQHIGTRIRTRRLALGISQEELGNALGLTFQQVQKYEKGANRVGGSRLYRIAEILQVEVGFFYEGLEAIKTRANDPETQAIEAFSASAEGITIARAFVRIKSPDVRQVVVKAIRELAQALEPAAELQAAE